MSKTNFLSLACMGLLAAASGGAVAQDGVSIATDNMAFAVPDYGSIALTQSILESTIEQSGGDAGKQPAARAGRGSAAYSAMPPWKVDYDPALSRRIQQQYLRNVGERIGPEGANAIAAHLEQAPVAEQFDRLAAPYGLSRSNLTDVIALYFAVAWATANAAPDPTREQVLGLRKQIRAAGAARAASRGMAQRQKIAESIMYRVAQLAVQRRIAARKGGESRRLVADSAQRTVLEQQGVDLRATRLTAAGFVRTD